MSACENDYPELARLPDLLTTEELSRVIRRAKNTIRIWAMRGSGPLVPLRTAPRAPLLWRKMDVIAFLNGAEGRAD